MSHLLPHPHKNKKNKFKIATAAGVETECRLYFTAGLALLNPGPGLFEPPIPPTFPIKYNNFEQGAYVSAYMK